MSQRRTKTRILTFACRAIFSARRDYSRLHRSTVFYSSCHHILRSSPFKRSSIDMSRTLAVSVQSVAVDVDGTIYPYALEYHVCDMADGAAVVARWLNLHTLCYTRSDSSQPTGNNSLRLTQYTQLRQLTFMVQYQFLYCSMGLSHQSERVFRERAGHHGGFHIDQTMALW